MWLIYTSKGHGEALANIRDALAPQLPGEIAAVGHRVVHGGASILGPALVDDAIVDEVDACAALAPLHNPANALGIRFARDTWGDVPHVVVPDTAFHTSSMAPEAFRYALPKHLYDDHGIRRYGFHGTSYALCYETIGSSVRQARHGRERHRLPSWVRRVDVLPSSTAVVSTRRWG